MDTREQIKQTKTEIKKCIFYLMKSLKERLSEEHIKKVKNDKGKLVDKKDYRYPFEMQLDELPFFSLYVNLKKATYENLLVLCHKADDLNDKDLEALNAQGIYRENGTLRFKHIKEFANNTLPFCTLNLIDLERYLDEIEESLLFSIPSYPVQAILIKLANFKYHTDKVLEDGTPQCSLFDDEGVLDIGELETLKSDSLWASSTIESYATDEEYVLPDGEQIGRAYIEGKGLAEKELPLEESNRSGVLLLLTQGHFKKLCGVVDTVVNTLLTPAYEIPEQTVLTILEETLTGMKRIVLAKQLDYFTQGSEKLFTKGELTKALGVASEKFNKYAIALYGDRAFTEEQLKNALRAINQPIDLLEIK